MADDTKVSLDHGTHASDFDDLDLDSLDDTSSDGKPKELTTRNAVTEVGRSALSGLVQPTNIATIARRAIEGALPNEYNIAQQASGNITSVSHSLYDKAVKDLSGPLKELKETAYDVVDSVKPYVSTGIFNRIKGALKSDSQEVPTSEPLNQDRITIDQTLDSIFNQNKTSQKVDQGNVKATLAYRRLATQQYKDQKLAINRLADYNDQINYPWQRKSLELQYLQFYVSRDQLEVFKAYARDERTYMESLIHNTGLPDMVKRKKNEEFSQIGRQRLYAKMNDNLYDQLGNFSKNLVGNLSDRFSGLSDNAGDAIRAISMGLGALSGASMSPMEAMTTLGAAGSSLAGTGIGKGIGRFAKSKLDKNETYKNFQNKLQSQWENIPSKLDKFAENYQGNIALPEFIRKRLGGKDGIQSESLKDLIRSIIPTLGADSYRAEIGITGEKSGDDTNWSERDSQALSVEIPGLLSRQLQMLIQIATGKKSERTVFNPEKGTFLSESKNTELVRKSIYGDTEKEKNEHLDSMVRILTAGQKNVLDDKATKALRSKILSDSLNSRSFDTADYRDHDYGDESVNRLIKETLGNVGNVIRRDIAGTHISKKLRDISKQIHRGIADQTVLGQNDALTQLGLTGENANQAVYNETGLGPEQPQPSVNEPPVVKPTPFTNTNPNTTNIHVDPFDYDQLRSALFKPYQDLQAIPVHVINFPDIKQSDTVSEKGPNPLISIMGDGLNQVNQYLNQIRQYCQSIVEEGVTSFTVSETTLAQSPSIVQSFKAVDSSGPSTKSSKQRPTQSKRLNKFKQRVIRKEDKSEQPTKPKEDKFGQWIKQKSDMVSQWTKQNSNIAGQWVRQNSDMANRWTKQNSNIAGQWVRQNSDMANRWTKQKGGAARQQIKQKRDELRQQAKQKGNTVNQWTKQSGDTASQWARQKGSVFSQQAKQGGDFANQPVKRKGDEFNQKGDAVNQWAKQIMGELSRQMHENADISRLFNSPLHTIVNAPVNVGKSLIKSSFSTSKWITNTGLGALKSTTSLAKKGFDVFVLGESNPALTEKGMQEGLYTDRNTGKIIRNLADITGPVINNFTKKVVLSKEDATRGLVTATGKSLFKLTKVFFKSVKLTNKIQTGLIKKSLSIPAKLLGVDEKGVLGSVKGIAGALSNPVGGAISIAGAAGKKILAAQQQSLVGIKDIVKGTLGGLANLLPWAGGGTKKRSKHNLDDILDYLKHRWPIKGKIAGDTDSDGVRDNSWRDIFKRRGRTSKDDRKSTESEDESTQTDKKTKSSDGGIFGLITSGLGSITHAVSSVFSAIKGIGSLLGTWFAFDKIKSAVGGASGVADDVADVAEMGKGGKKGIISNLLRYGKKGAGWLFGKGKSLLGALGGATGIGATAAEGAGVAGEAAAGGGLLSAIGGGLSAAAGAVGSVLSAPVLLGAAAAAGIAYGGYKIYEHYHDRRKPGDIEKLRMYMYGFDPSNGDHLAKLRGLEDGVSKHITGTGAKVRYQLSLKKSVNEFAEDMGVDTSSAKQMRWWAEWFAKRFIPVYMVSLGQLRSIDSKLDLNEADSALNDSQKVTYIRDILMPSRYTNGIPWSFVGAPVEGMAVNITGKEVKALADSLIKKFESKHLNKDKDAKGKPKIAPKVVVPPKPNTPPVKPVAPSPVEPVVKAHVKSDGGNLILKAASHSTGKTKMILPVDEPIIQEYGFHVDLKTMTRKFTGGVVFQAEHGTPVKAAADGVVYRMYYSKVYGNVVYLKHKDGHATRYAHLSGFRKGLAVGDTVAQGYVIGYVGASGDADQNELLWEVRIGTGQWAKTVDPMTLVSKKDKERVSMENTKVSLQTGKRVYVPKSTDSSGPDTLKQSTSPSVNKSTVIPPKPDSGAVSRVKERIKSQTSATQKLVGHFDRQMKEGQTATTQRDTIIQRLNDINIGIGNLESVLTKHHTYMPPHSNAAPATPNHSTAPGTSVSSMVGKPKQVSPVVNMRG